MLTADVGVEATQRIIRDLTDQVRRKELNDPETLTLRLKQQLLDILRQSEQPLPPRQQDKPLVILMVGINGAGKTTTIGKLARKFQNDGETVMLAAGDSYNFV